MLLLVLVSTVSAWQVPAGGRITTAVVRPQAAVCPAMFSGGKAAPKKRWCVRHQLGRARNLERVLELALLLKPLLPHLFILGIE